MFPRDLPIKVTPFHSDPFRSRLSECFVEIVVGIIVIVSRTADVEFSVLRLTALEIKMCVMLGHQ